MSLRKAIRLFSFTFIRLEDIGDRINIDEDPSRHQALQIFEILNRSKHFILWEKFSREKIACAFLRVKVCI